MNNIRCPVCGGISSLLEDKGSNWLYTCDSCGNEFHVRIHFVDVPIPLEARVFKAIVNADDLKMARKLQIKAKKVFGGMSNFYPVDLDRQVLQGASTWNLGFYSDEEVEKLKLSAAEFGLDVEFVLS